MKHDLQHMFQTKITFQNREKTGGGMENIDKQCSYILPRSHVPGKQATVQIPQL